jgi:hypothetical protein
MGRRSEVPNSAGRTSSVERTVDITRPAPEDTPDADGRISCHRSRSSAMGDHSQSTLITRPV